MIGRTMNPRDPKHLLDIPHEQNIGNGTILQPQVGGPTVIPQTNPERILMLSGPSSSGQTTSVALTASRIVPGPQNSTPGFPGPITGIIEFGNGGQFTRAEVDIPIGPFAGAFTVASSAIQPQDGGVIITVPTGVLRVYARYDNLLIQPMLQAKPGQPIQSLAQAYGQLFEGPGAPAILPPTNNATSPPIPAEPVEVKAMAAYFSRHTSKVYRTHYLYLADKAQTAPDSLQPLPISYTSAISLPSHGMPTPCFCIPPFARAVKVLRQNIGVAVNVYLYDNNFNLLDLIQIPGGSAPIIPLMGTETIIGLTCGAIWFLALCYEIGI